MEKPVYFFILIVSMMFPSCDKEVTDTSPEYEIMIPQSPLDKGSRKLNIAPSDGVSGFSSTFAAMEEVGVGLVELNLEWSYFEQSQGIYTDPQGLLQAVGFYADNGIEIGISLATINTVRRTDPEYLNDLPYDHPIYISSFNNLMDWILETIPDRVNVDYISLGNEINYLLEGEEQWSQYTGFMKSAMSHLQEQYPGIKYGAKVTITDGLLGVDQENILNVIEISDVAMLNYYPQDHNFKVFDLDEIQEQMDEVLNLVEAPIYLTEIGYQSGSEYCGSSEIKQAEFFHWLFSFWDKHPNEIEFVQINWMHDISDGTLKDYSQYYGSNTDPFLEYLGTLGVKNHDETSKLAWHQIKMDANSRGWR